MQTILYLFGVIVNVSITFGFPAAYNESQCQPWSFLTAAVNTTQCKCYAKDKGLRDAVLCTDQGTLLQFGYCMTYEESNGTFLVECPYVNYYHTFNVSNLEYIQLPQHLSELSKSMCDPLNREGRGCNECKGGHALAINSFDYNCIKCSEKWYNIIFYILMESVPVTLFFFIILVFHVRLTSPPMTCFIMYSQLIVYVTHTEKTEFEKLNLQVYHIHTQEFVRVLYGISNLEFFQYAVPLFCIKSNLKIIHVQLLGYVPALYLLCLITVTWICIELHDRNFKPLVFLWRPFHRSCVQLHREWNTTYDITDVFASFFLLSYGKLMYQSLQLLSFSYFWNLKNGTQDLVHKRVTLFDPTVEYFSTAHLPYAVIGIICFLLFSILPTLLLVLYPTRLFRACIGRCRLSIHHQAALQTFVEKFHHCYRDGLDGGRDMRSFSGLYFILRGVVMVSHELQLIKLRENTWFFRTLIMAVVALVFSFMKPYKKWYMNLIDTLLLSLLAFLSFMINIHNNSGPKLIHFRLFSTVIEAAACVPLVIFMVYAVYKVALKSVCTLKKKVRYCYKSRSEIELHDSYESLT